MGCLKLTYHPTEAPEQNWNIFVQGSEKSQGNQKKCFNYYPYGKVLREYTYGVQDRYLSTHHERDQETGYDYRGARFYDSEVGRFLSLDPLASEYPTLSDYSYVAGNPIAFVDPNGKKIINAHKASRNQALNKLNNTKAQFASLSKGDKGYTRTKKAVRNAQKSFNKINAKYKRVNNKINDIKRKDINLYNKANNLKDEVGNKVDLYVYDVKHEYLNSNRTDTKTMRIGVTDLTKDLEMVDFETGKTSHTVKSEMHGPNTGTIKMSNISTSKDLAHEFGHAIYQATKTTEYVNWIKKNPDKVNGFGLGHGPGNPSGEAAKAATKNFN